MNYTYLHFFNIQYWYCVIVSLFGQKCTYVDTLTGVSITLGGTATTTAATATTSVHPSFWSWLFGAGSAFGIVGTIFGFAWGLFSFLSYTASFFLFILIATCAVGLFLIRIKEQEMYGNLSHAPDKPHPLRARWQELLEHTMSGTPSRWKEAILTADAMLGELLGTIGYEGTNTAERIQKVPEGAFANLPSAWEAHRIKNFVFATNSHFILTQREAFRTMKLYEQVFKEFDFI